MKRVGPTQTVTNSANTKYRTNSSCEIQLDKPNIESLPSSSSASSPFQLDNYDDGPMETDRPIQMARNNSVVSEGGPEGLSFHNESMKMVQLLGSLCQHTIKPDDRAMIHASWAWSAVR